MRLADQEWICDIQGLKKQENKNFTKNIIIYIYLLNILIWTNRRGETKLLPIGPNKIVQKII